MTFHQSIVDFIEQAESRAMATTGPHGLNVVPLSMLRVVGGSVWLFDFFMEKTTENLTAEPSVALTVWSGLTGLQLKGATAYHTEGEQFDEAVAWVKTQNPARTVRGLIVLTPNELHDVSPGGVFTPESLKLL